MGFYINQTKAGALGALGKADSLILHEDAVELLDCPTTFPTDRAVICVVNNGPFEAAAFAYSKDEMDAFNDPYDSRPKRWLTMDLARAKALTGFSR